GDGGGGGEGVHRVFPSSLAALVRLAVSDVGKATLRSGLWQQGICEEVSYSQVVAGKLLQWFWV
ncbi:hypothetical protein, partial [Nocardiopsis alborubida]|uniref:hypothetical protein n=1 Tax=Nocardiopsis alborubida TaxID=146802 RepID=UPI001B34E486